MRSGGGREVHPGHVEIGGGRSLKQLENPSILDDWRLLLLLKLLPVSKLLLVNLRRRRDRRRRRMKRRDGEVWNYKFKINCFCPIFVLLTERGFVEMKENAQRV